MKKASRPTKGTKNTKKRRCRPKKVAVPPRPRGRPTVYSEEIGKYLSERMATGEPLKNICLDEHTPSYSTCNHWLADETHPFSAIASRARVAASYAWTEERLEIADDTSRDTLVNDQGFERPNSEWISRSKLRAEVRRDLAGKFNPKVFGEKMHHVDATPPVPEDDLDRMIKSLVLRVMGGE